MTGADPERRDSSVDTPAFRPNGVGEDDRNVGRMAVPPVSTTRTLKSSSFFFSASIAPSEEARSKRAVMVPLPLRSLI